MWFSIIVLVWLLIAKPFLKKRAIDRVKTTVAIANLEMTTGLTACFFLLASTLNDEKNLYYGGELTEEDFMTFWAGMISCVLIVEGVVALCELLIEKIKAIEVKLLTMTSTDATTSEDRKTLDAESENESAPKNAEPIANKHKMRDVNNGWKCVCCGQANKDVEQWCVGCGVWRYETETGTAVDDARQARIIDHNVVCPACGTMQETSRKVCRNCGTKFVSAEVLSQE